jgi:hypothetical protein
MQYIRLSKSIRSLALKHYKPFHGFNVEAITEAVQKHLAVSDFEVRCALEIICDNG